MLKVTLTSWSKWKESDPTLVVFAFQGDRPVLLGLRGKDIETVGVQIAVDGFKGKELETAVTHRYSGLQTPAERLAIIGLGKKADFTLEVLRRCASKALRMAETMNLRRIAVLAPGIKRNSAEELQTLSEGLYLSSYHFNKHRSIPQDAPKPVEEVTLWTENINAAAQSALERGRIYAQATMLARDLINEPPSRMNPERLAAEALKINKSPISVVVLEKKDLDRLGMGALLGVGAGGAVPPRFVEIVYKPGKKARIVVALVGKGITFDSGGLSLKPALSMETMKDDMSGAAAVLGVMSALAELKPAVEVRGYMAIAENMPGGRAQKPGDVLKAFNGKTIEVLNTDAEGRLVLADALAYACSKNPDVVIDIATLTGACVVALGHRVSAVMTNTPKLFQAIRAAGIAAGEKFWELPLEKEYEADVKSKIADLQNIGKRRGEAGAIIGGLFLKEFVDDRPWAHIDIAGPSWSDSDQPYCPTGGTGHPVRTLLHYIENL